jgi:hypothetical protein
VGIKSGIKRCLEGIVLFLVRLGPFSSWHAGMQYDAQLSPPGRLRRGKVGNRVKTFAHTHTPLLPALVAFARQLTSCINAGNSGPCRKAACRKYNVRWLQEAKHLSSPNHIPLVTLQWTLRKPEIVQSQPFGFLGRGAQSLNEEKNMISVSSSQCMHVSS